MSWNNGLERKKFEARMAKQAKEYRKAGMTEEQIQAMYEFDLEQFNSDRRYYMHTQPLEVQEVNDEGDEVDDSFIRQFIDAFSTLDEDEYFLSSDRYGWIDCIENTSLSEAIREMDPDEIEIITLHVYEGYDFYETADIMGMTYRQVWYRWRKIAEKISELFSDVL